MGESTLAEESGFGYIWENYYDKEARLNEYDMTFFFREGDAYRKSTEIHIQRAFTLGEIKKAVRQSPGMESYRYFGCGYQSGCNTEERTNICDSKRARKIKWTGL